MRQKSDVLKILVKLLKNNCGKVHTLVKVQTGGPQRY